MDSWGEVGVALLITLLVFAVGAMIYYYFAVYIKKPKWVFYQGLDSNLGDIGQFPGTLPEIKAKCLSEPLCKGFNDNGWIKSTIRPIEEWYRWTDDPNKGFRLRVFGSEKESFPKTPDGRDGILEYE